MKKWLIILLLLAPFVYAYYHKPQVDIHHEKISAAAKEFDPTFNPAEAAGLPEWDELEMVDWVIFNATRDKKQYSLVSFGLVDTVFLLDPDWALTTFKLKKTSS